MLEVLCCCSNYNNINVTLLLIQSKCNFVKQSVTVGKWAAV